MRELTSEIEIDAPPERVWRLLTDFDAHGDWNPIEIEMKGQPIEGTILEHTSRLPGSRPMRFRPTIVEVAPEQALAWEGRARLRQSEQFWGC